MRTHTHGMRAGTHMNRQQKTAIRREAFSRGLKDHNEERHSNPYDKKTDPIAHQAWQAGYDTEESWQNYR